MILAWVISLLLVCTSVIVYLERLTVLRTVELQTIEQMQKQFIASEQSILECEQNMLNLTNLEFIPCFIQPAGNNRWLISSKEKPTIQIHVYVDQKTDAVTRLNWRQAFE